MWVKLADKNADHTLFAKVTGKVHFHKKGTEQKQFVSIVPVEAEKAESA